MTGPNVFPLRMDLPAASDIKSGEQALSAILDVATEMGKVTPAEIGFGDMMSLMMCYGMLKGFIETAQKRRDKAEKG